MNPLERWLKAHGLTNPHNVPPELAAEFKRRFPIVFWPQPGGQERFQKCPADLCLYGGKAGSGKSWNLLLDKLKWIQNPKYVGTIVRKTYAMIFDAGGIWEEAKEIYGKVGGKYTRGDKPKFVFPSGAQIYFKHSQHATHVDEYWQGLQSATIHIDELTHFSKAEFLYIMSRNRSMSGINSYMRMTCNPDPHSWVKKLIEWWIDDDGFIREDRCGIIRYFVHKDDCFIMRESAEELREMFGPQVNCKSFTFISGHLEENRRLLEKDPGYVASLENLTMAQRRALRDGNWNEVDLGGGLFSRETINRHRVETVALDRLVRIVIGVDPGGGTGEHNDATGIAAAGKDENGDVFVLHDKTGKFRPSEWAAKVCDLYDLLKADRIVAERNFGGDMVESTIISHRKDVSLKMVTSTRGKIVRAEPVSALYDMGKVHHVGHGLSELEDEMCSYRPGASSPNRMDALVFAITELVLKSEPEASIRVL